MVEFKDLGLRSDILRAIEERGYTTPTPIQELAIPYVLMDRDLMACAQTGTGKTAGFCLPMLEILSTGGAKARMPRSLILEPTRELAAQVAENFAVYGKHLNFTAVLLTGGKGMEEQIKKLDRGVDVLIATPGRMIDLFERGNILLHDIRIFVIDEADRMLDMGFIPDVEKIAGLLPKLRQTLFFSATLLPEIRALAGKFLRNPKEVSVAPPATTAATVAQYLLHVSPRGKREALRGLLRRETLKNAFIFCNRKRDVRTLAESLTRHKFSVVALHGDMPQNRRDEALEKFRSGAVPFLVCSDVAARGLDIKGVDAVFNFDVPFNAEDYVHRIGRTGRAGREGHAYTFVAPDDDRLLANIVALIRKDIPVMEGFEPRPDALVPAGDEEPADEDFVSRHKQRAGRRERGGWEHDRHPRGHGSRRSARKPAPAESRAPRPGTGPGAPTIGFGDDMPRFLVKPRARAGQRKEETV